MEHLPVRSYAAGLLLAALITFTGTLSYHIASAGRQPESRAPASPSDTKAPAAKPSSPQAQPAQSTQPPAPQWPGSHSVRAGETLFSIAKAYGTDVPTLKLANGLTSDQIQAGKVLKVPGAKVVRQHKVQQGESLWEIAGRYSISLEALLASNPDVDNPGHLQIGQALTLPANAAAGDAVAATITPVANLDGAFAWPVLARISSPFGPRDGRNHNGLDIAAQSGEPIKAARDGEVFLAGTVPGYGETVILRHEDGTQTLYAHCSRLLVKSGERVRQGEVIAEVGSTGRSTGPHLHFEIIVNNKPHDPLLYLPKR